MRRPLIGITSSLEKAEYPKTLQLNRLYAEAIYAAGGLPMILPVLEDRESIEETIQRIHGLLLPGGVDVDPLLFHEEPFPGQGRIDPQRDAFELMALKLSYSMKRPCLGICRGCQMIAVALGGTLYQDIEREMKDTMLKHSQEAPYWYPTHSIEIERESILGEIYGSTEAVVNSFHHQAVKDTGPHLYTSAKAPDGIIEAIEHRGDFFFMGVQWHPEHLWEREEETLDLFRTFVKRSKETYTP